MFFFSSTDKTLRWFCSKRDFLSPPDTRAVSQFGNYEGGSGRAGWRTGLFTSNSRDSWFEARSTWIWQLPIILGWPIAAPESAFGPPSSDVFTFREARLAGWLAVRSSSPGA